MPIQVIPNFLSVRTSINTNIAKIKHSRAVWRFALFRAFTLPFIAVFIIFYVTSNINDGIGGP